MVLVYLTSHYWYVRAKEYVMQFLKVTAGIAQATIRTTEGLWFDSRERQSCHFLFRTSGLWPTHLPIQGVKGFFSREVNPLKPELNPIFYLLALLGAQHFLHVSRIMVKLLTFKLLMS